MKTLQNNFTTPEQSKRLLELGVPVDSADQVYYEDIMWGAHEFLSPEHPYSEVVKEHENISLPCWSVGRLMEIYDTCFISPKSRSYWCAHTRLIGVQYVDYILDCYKNALADNLLDFSKLDE